MQYFEHTLVIDLCYVFFIGPKHISSTQNGTLSICGLVDINVTFLVNA